MKTIGRMLALVLLLQGMILAAHFTQNGGGTPAYAQIPDAGAQRMAIVDELKALNTKMDKLVGILESGKLQVHVATPDEKK